MRLTEINLFGVYVAPMSSMMGCRLGGDDRTALVRRPFWPDAIRSPRAIGAALRLRRRRRRVSIINPVIPAAYGRSREVLWRLPDGRAILRRLPFVSRRFQCEWQLPAQPSRCRRLRRRPVNRTHSSRSALAARAGLHAPHLPFATRVTIGSIGWKRDVPDLPGM